ncbi:MAG: FAD-binding oxidoreductase, partial [Streptosporangiaceae bacterium]
MPGLIEDLRAVTGPAHVLTEPDLVAGYCTDWTRRYAGPAACVVRPASTAETAAVIRACAAYGLPVIAQGGNTGLVGGSVPAAGQAGSGPDRPVIVSTRRLTGLDPVDPGSAQVTAGAGVTIAALAAHAAGAGFRYGVDLASRDSATVGGTIATNAGGIRTIRHGPTRDQVAGITAVLADGSVVSDLSGLTAGSAGYDLAQLLTGSEGTLGVITRARLRLRPAETPAAVVLAGTAGIGPAVTLLARVRAAVPGVLAAEYLDAAGMALVRAAAGLPEPLPGQHHGYLLAELAAESAGRDGQDQLERLASVLPSNTALATDARGMAALWSYRERLTEAVSTAGVPHKMDVALPPARLAGFCAELPAVVRAATQPAGAAVDGPAVPHAAGQPGPARLIVFGHLGVGNLHVNVVGPDPGDVTVDAAVARLAADHGGSVAAEHGVGRAKTGWLAWTRSPAELAAMRAIKSALDPSGLLNPGVLLAPVRRPTWAPKSLGAPAPQKFGGYGTTCF